MIPDTELRLSGCLYEGPDRCSRCVELEFWWLWMSGRNCGVWYWSCSWIRDNNVINQSFLMVGMLPTHKTAYKVLKWSHNVKCLSWYNFQYKTREVCQGIYFQKNKKEVFFLLQFKPFYDNFLEAIVGGHPDRKFRQALCKWATEVPLYWNSCRKGSRVANMPHLNSFAIVS